MAAVYALGSVVCFYAAICVLKLILEEISNY